MRHGEVSERRLVVHGFGGDWLRIAFAQMAPANAVSGRAACGGGPRVARVAESNLATQFCLPE